MLSYEFVLLLDVFIDVSLHYIKVYSQRPRDELPRSQKREDAAHERSYYAAWPVLLLHGFVNAVSIVANSSILVAACDLAARRDCTMRSQQSVALAVVPRPEQAYMLTRYER